jgi:formylglycine-generating enzyme required for sulfatase activity
MVAIPGGTFLMGSPKNEPERSGAESPRHEVAIEPFFMGHYPVTQTQWLVVSTMPQIEREIPPNPSQYKGDDRPVERVPWYDAVEFCARLSAHTGRQYRLPTEAEWEYACRASTTTPFHFGETIRSDLATYQGSTAYAGGPIGENADGTNPVDHFGLANAFGLSDMHGNVWEWCQDHWHDSYKGAPTDGSAWIKGGDSERRILRGGSWLRDPGNCRSAYRYYDGPDDRYFCNGFRVVCSAPRAL